MACIEHVITLLLLCLESESGEALSEFSIAAGRARKSTLAQHGMSEVHHDTCVQSFVKQLVCSAIYREEIEHNHPATESGEAAWTLARLQNPILMKIFLSTQIKAFIPLTGMSSHRQCILDICQTL